jgi:hypothetical protein
MSRFGDTPEDWKAAGLSGDLAEVYATPAHPAAEIFPLMPDDELRDLAANIKGGQRDPIAICDGKVLDGRNRLRACRLAGVRPRVEHVETDDPLGFVLSRNLHRRHLNSAQRAALAVELLPMLEAEAKERQRAAGGDRKSAKAKAGGSVPQKVAGAVGEARDLAARIARTNKQYVSAAKRLKEEAPDLFEKVKRGESDVFRAKAKVNQRKKLAELEAYHAAHPVGAGAFLEVEYRPSWSARNEGTLRAEVAARPDFAARREEASRLKAEAERLRREAVEAERRHYDLERQLDRDIYSTVCAEHGPIVHLRFACYEVGEAERQRIEAIEDPEEQYQEILWLTLHCLDCGTKLTDRDEFVCCGWCNDHRGKTHCMDCGCPLSGDEADGWCKECDPPMASPPPGVAQDARGGGEAG